MDTSKIIANLRAELNRLEKAIAAVESLTGISAKGGTTFGFGANRPTRGGRRQMSAAGRKRISEAAKKRWAARRKAAARPSSASRTIRPPIGSSPCATASRLCQGPSQDPHRQD